MLDYQMLMIAREVSQERVQGQPPAQGLALSEGLQHSHRAVRAFLTALAAQSANIVLALRYQNRHRSVEGRT